MIVARVFAINYLVAHAKVLLQSKFRKMKKDGILKVMLQGSAMAIPGILIMHLVYYLWTRTAALRDVNGREADQFTSIPDCLKQKIAKERIVGIYRGMKPLIYDIFLYRASYFGFYDASKPMTEKISRRPGGNLEPIGPLMVRFFIAQAVVTGSGPISYPLDMISKRLTMQSCLEPKKFKSMRGGL